MHFVLYVVFGVLRKSGRLTRVAGLLVEYVNSLEVLKVNT
jgi:hypothetical protein